MASQIKSAGLGENIGSGAIWTTPTNIYTSNNAYAYTNIDFDGETTRWLRATNFDFEIPVGATIDGIVVEFEKRANESYAQDYSVKIVKAGTEQGTDKKKTGVAWPLSDTYVSYGGAADKWGLTWTPAQINASNFGVSISALFEDGEEDDVTVYVDHVRITVYYTEPATNIKINIADAWKDVEEVKINVGDSWKTVTEVWINISDVWRRVF